MSSGGSQFLSMLFVFEFKNIVTSDTNRSAIQWCHQKTSQKINTFTLKVQPLILNLVSIYLRENNAVM